jgi:predicted Zn-dependent protease
LHIIDVDGPTNSVVLDSQRRFAAPEWAADGKSFVVNGSGKLWRAPANGGEPTPIAIGKAGWIDINHGLSPKDQFLAFTAGGSLFRAPAAGGAAEKVLPASPSYFHAWSPDGKTIAYSAIRGGGLNIYATSIDGGQERRLTTGAGPDDSPQYSQDGRWIYYVSERGKKRGIWRMPADGAGPNDARAEQITSDDAADTSPHPSPDGKWLVFLSHAPGTAANVRDRDASIRKLPLPGERATPDAKPVEIARVVGGHGTLSSRPFSPDGKQLVFAEFEPPPPSIRIVLFTPSDVQVPTGVSYRLTQIADATEKFLFEGMKRWKYEPAVDHIFRRNADRTVEYITVKGDKPVSDPFYTKASCRFDAVEKAKAQSRVAGDGHIWWIFLYVGDRPKRFSGWEGGGNVRDGGTAIVNYDTVPGEIRADLNPSQGFNNEYALKGTIHELGHALGLPHIGPDVSLGLGNSLMGPNNDVYAARRLPKADRCYLTEASAAMLLKHPVFSGTAKDRFRQPAASITDFKQEYNKQTNQIRLSGKLVSDMKAHSVVVLDDVGNPDDTYWFRSFVARIEPDGTFKVTVKTPTRADGHFLLSFCFENGVVTGTTKGILPDDHGPLRTGYKFRNGNFTFGD